MPSFHDAIPDSHRDLLTSEPIVTVATIGSDGLPQLTATWFLLTDDGSVVISLNNTRQKVRNMRRTPVATLFFVEPGTPGRTLEIRARVTLEPDPDHVVADRVAAKYGMDSLRAMDRPGETRVVAHFAPVRVNTFG